ncbi:MAG: hypothetical protein ACK5LY_01040, partial [Lachnospirales bacterium]
VTKKELSQLYWLNKEIVIQKQRLDELECLATSCTSNITGMPKGMSGADKSSDYIAEIVDLKALIELNIKKCFYELNRINCYIESVEDSQMRMILSLRYVNGLSWQQIAFSIGGNTAESVRKAHDRFLAKN